MRYAVLFLVGLFCFVSAYAQTPNPLPLTEIEWTELQHDFGSMEEGSPIEHTFWFKNSGKNPLQISNVMPTCGCTTPDWTKEIVEPGDRGYVKLVFDSHGRLGLQSKMVTVVANTDPANTVLQFKVDVFAGPPPGPEDNVNKGTAEVPAPILEKQLIEGSSRPTTSIRFTETTYSFGSISAGDSLTHDFRFTNTGANDLVLKDVKASCGCTIPEWPRGPISPGAEGIIKVTFNSAGKSGTQDKTITVLSNAEPSAVVLHIKGDVDMGPMPRIQLNDVIWTYVKKDAPKKLKKVFTFTNKGDAPLTIRSYQTNCDCLTAQIPAKPVAPGETGEIPVTLLTKGCTCEGTIVFIVNTNGFPEEAGITIMPQ